MKKATVLFANGFEEVEALSVVDVFKRAGVDCSMIGLTSLEVTGSHGITVKMDGVFDETLSSLDAIVLPGGMPGAKNLKADKRVLQLLQTMYQQNRVIGAICAAPIVLQAAKILKGHNVTCYPGFEDELKDATFVGGQIQVDGNIVTGNGPAAALAFSYALLERLEIDSLPLQKAMQYHKL